MENILMKVTQTTSIYEVNGNSEPTCKDSRTRTRAVMSETETQALTDAMNLFLAKSNQDGYLVQKIEESVKEANITLVHIDTPNTYKEVKIKIN